MHDLSVTRRVNRLLDALPDAQEIAARFYGPTPFDMLGSTASKAPSSSQWDVRLRYRGRSTGIEPERTPPHELTLRLRDHTLRRAQHRALDFAGKYYQSLEHVLVESHATEETNTDRYIVTFTFMALTETPAAVA